MNQGVKFNVQDDYFKKAVESLLIQEGYQVTGDAPITYNLQLGYSNNGLHKKRITNKNYAIPGRDHGAATYVYVRRAAYIPEYISYLKKHTNVLDGYFCLPTGDYPLSITLFCRGEYVAPIALYSYSFSVHNGLIGWPASVGRLMPLADKHKFLIKEIPDNVSFITFVIGGQDGKTKILDVDTHLWDRAFLLAELLKINLGEFFIRLFAGLSLDDIQSQDMAATIPVFLPEHIIYNIIPRPDKYLKHMHLIGSCFWNGNNMLNRTKTHHPVYYASGRGPQSCTTDNGRRVKNQCVRRCITSINRYNFPEVMRQYKLCDFDPFIDKLIGGADERPSDR